MVRKVTTGLFVEPKMAAVAVPGEAPTAEVVDEWDGLEVRDATAFGPAVPASILVLVKDALETGKRKIVYIADAAGTPWEAERVRRFETLVRAAGLGLDARVRIVDTEDQGRKALGLTITPKKPKAEAENAQPGQ